MADRVIQRHDTAARWQSINPVLAEGELGIVIDGAKGYKIGDGVTAWNNLEYPANPTSVVQELGNDENAVISQKTVSTYFDKIEAENNTNMLISGDIIYEMGTALTTKGTLVVVGNYFVTKDLLLITPEISSINLKNLYSNTGSTVAGICFYKEDKTFIGYYNKIPIGYFDVKIKDIISQFPDAVYFRVGGAYPVPLLVESYVESKDDKTTVCSTMLNARGEEFQSYSDWDNQASCYLAKDTGIYKSGVGAEGYFYVTPFIPVRGISKVTFEGATFSNVSFYVFYDETKQIISQANGVDTKPYTVDVDVPQNAYYVRFCGDVRYSLKLSATGSVYKQANNAILLNTLSTQSGLTSASLFLNSLYFKNKSNILTNDGSIMYHETWGMYDVTDFIPVSSVLHYKFLNLLAWKAAQANPIAFYDANYNVIGTAYNPASVSTATLVDITISDELLANYPNASYVRIGIDNTYNWSFISPVEEKIQPKSDSEPYPSYKFNMFNKVLCGGDSVTKGFVVEGTAEKQYIYQEMPEYSYPTQLGKIHTNLNITTAAQSGINCINWLANFYPTITFSEYDLFILELGLNGGLDINDINTPGTNTYAYAQIVSGARTQNPNMIIALVRSQHFGTIWGPVIEALVSQYDCIYVDLHDTTYLNLDDPIYHGYYQNGSQRDFDYAHFTRKGYNAKAYVIERLIADKLTDTTIYK